MKNLFVIILLFITLRGNAQAWVTLTDVDLGIYIGVTSYIRVDVIDNSIWFGSQTRLYHLKEGLIETEINYSADSGPSNVAIVNDLIVHNGVLWGLDDYEGLFKYDAGVFTIMAGALKDGYTINVDSEDTLWVGSSALYSQAFFGYANGSYDLYTTGTPGIISNNVYSVLCDGQDRKWITYWTSTSGAGYSLFENGAWNYYHISNTDLPTQHVKKFVESPTDTIWGATRHGICRFDESLQNWVTYNKLNTNMPSEFVSDIQFDSQGRMWALFKDTALAYTTNYTDWTIFDESNSPINVDEVVTFAIDTLDNIWVSGTFELHVLTLGTFNNWLANPIFESTNISIYPNPTSGNLTIEGVEQNDVVTIFNMQGEIMFKSVNDKLTFTTDLSKFADGTYLVRIEGSDKIVTKKILVRK